MNKKTAFEVLHSYNRYRRGAIEFQEMGYTPCQIGQAIDTALEMLELNLELAVDTNKENIQKRKK